jgi:peroxiredoxin
MNDARLTALLRDYDRPIEANAQFADRLYGLLAVELGFAEERVPWWRRWTGGLAVPQAGPLRYAFLLGVLALLLALAASLALIGALLLFNQRSAVDIVQSSQAVYQHPPPFELTLQNTSGGEERYAWDGVDTLRIDIVKPGGAYSEPAGSYYVRTSTTEARYNAGDRTWTVVPYSSIKTASGGPYGRPFPLWGLPLTWVPEGVPFGAGQEPPLLTCPDWQRGPDETVLGRAAFHLSCANPSRNLWIDQQYLLLLRSEAFGPGPEAVTEFVPSPSFPAGEFSLVEPTGAHAPEEGPVSTLAIGDPLPATTAQSLEGAVFDFASLRGRPTAIYLWCSCTQGPQVRFLSNEASARSATMNFALVGIGTPNATLAGLITLHDIHFPVLAEGNSLQTDWQIRSFPALLLLDAEGRVVGYTGNYFSQADLAAILDALMAGQPIPSPAGKPAPPADVVSSVLVPGTPAPDWTRPELGRGQLSITQTRGKPTAVYFWDPNIAPDVVEGLVAAWQKRSDTISLVLVVQEEGPVTAKGFVDQHQWKVPVAYDWDGEAADRWGLIYYESLVLLDADGNVLTVLGQFDGDPGALFDALAAGTPLPSPTVYPGKSQ